MKKTFFILILFISACGGGGQNIDTTFLNTDSPQVVVIAALPNSAKVGSTIQVQGIGFSPVMNQNVILVAGTSTAATAYSLVASPSTSGGATDQLSFVLPSQASVGSSTLQVLVGENPSNAIAFTVESP